jgi:hypothetical protein
MNDEERTREREHWQAIAEQLGLAPEPAGPAHRQRPEAERAEPPPAAAPSRDRAPSPPDQRAEAHKSPVAAKTLAEAAPAARTVIPEPPEKLEPAAIAPAPRDEEKSRGRGRRKRGSKQSKTGAESEPELAKDVSSPEQESSAHSKRERGRGRKKQGRTKPRAEEQSPEAGRESTGPAEPVQTDEDDEGYGDWTVPSWTELIGSLYRPER